MNQQFQPPQGHRILLESTYDIRAMARSALAKKWVPAAIACFVVSFLVSFPAGLLDGLLGKTYDLMDIPAYRDAFANLNIDLSDVDLTFKVSPLSGIYTLLVSGPLIYGLAMVFMRNFRTGDLRPFESLNGFQAFGRSILLLLFMSLFIFLWAMIPIAGAVLAIIAAVRYSMSFMLAVDYQNVSVPNLVKMSKHMMQGNKGKYFLLQLSFIGWYILAGIATAVIVGIFGLVSDSWFSILIANTIGSFAVAFVTAYNQSADVAFYDLLNGRVPGKVVWQEGPAWQNQDWQNPQQ